MPAATPPAKPSAVKIGKPPRSLEDEIAAVEAKLRTLRERKKEEERRELERNQRAIAGLLRDERLDMVGVEKWRLVVRELRALLCEAGVRPERTLAIPLDPAPPSTITV